MIEDHTWVEVVVGSSLGTNSDATIVETLWKDCLRLS